MNVHISAMTSKSISKISKRCMRREIQGRSNLSPHILRPAVLIFTKMTLIIQDFVRALPKAELHLHLEGTVNATTLVELSRRVDTTPMTLEEAEAVYTYTDFTGFLNAFHIVAKKIAGPGEYELVTTRMIEQLAVAGVVHAEVYLSVGDLFRARQTTRETDGEVFLKTMDAIERARIQGEREHGVSIYWLLDSSRHEGLQEAERVFHTADKFRTRYPSIIGIGLGGDERVHASEPFRGLYAEAGRAGLRLTNHAGENTPASFI